MAVLDSLDVRLRGSTLEHGLSVNGGRLEASECVVSGVNGSTFTCPGGNGSDAVSVSNAGRLHLYRTSLQGGHGGAANDPFNCQGGDAGNGIVVKASNLLLAGDPSHEIRGGSGGGPASSTATTGCP